MVIQARKMYFFMGLTISLKIEIIYYADFSQKLFPNKQKLLDIIRVLFRLAEKKLVLEGQF
jgi:hypothetical protein